MWQHKPDYEGARVAQRLTDCRDLISRAPEGVGVRQGPTWTFHMILAHMYVHTLQTRTFACTERRGEYELPNKIDG